MGYARKPARMPFNSKQVNAIAKIANKVDYKKMEKKFYLVANTRTPLVGTPYIDSLSNVVQSTTASTDNTRSGDSIYMTSLQLNYALAQHVSASATLIRVMLIQYKSDTTPQTTEIYQGSTDYLGFLNPDARQTVRVLYDKIHMLSVDGNSGDASVHRKICFKFPFGKKVQYVNAGVTGTNKIWLVITTNESSFGPTIEYESKLTFVDP